MSTVFGIHPRAVHCAMLRVFMSAAYGCDDVDAMVRRYESSVLTPLFLTPSAWLPMLKLDPSWS